MVKLRDTREDEPSHVLVLLDDAYRYSTKLYRFPEILTHQRSYFLGIAVYARSPEKSQVPNIRCIFYYFYATRTQDSGEEYLTSDICPTFWWYSCLHSNSDSPYGFSCFRGHSKTYRCLRQAYIYGDNSIHKDFRPCLSRCRILSLSTFSPFCVHILAVIHLSPHLFI
jgi:hypothetical protein